jgi:hypothetical protein
VATGEQDVSDRLGFEIVNDILDGIDLTEADSAAIESRLAMLLDQHERARERWTIGAPRDARRE